MTDTHDKSAGASFLKKSSFLSGKNMVSPEKLPYMGRFSSPRSISSWNKVGALGSTARPEVNG